MDQARLVTYPDLRRKLLPYVGGWKWAEDAIRDLWLLGAPIPNDRCPEAEETNKPCKAYPFCNHIRRVLLPGAFADWWEEVASKEALDIAVEHVFSPGEFV